MSTRTTFLGRLIGLYCILIPLSMAVNKAVTVEMVTGLMHNPPVLFLFSSMAVAAGLALVMAHNVWSGGVLPVVVTLIGWMTLTKGLLLLFLPPGSASGLVLGGLHYERWFYFYAGFTVVLGICMTVMSVAGKERVRV
jgi:hypothetical protein